MASEQHQETSCVYLKLSNDRFHERKDIWGLVNQYQTETNPHGENIEEFSICYGMPEESKSYIAQFAGKDTNDTTLDLDLTVGSRTINTIVIFNSSEEGKQFLKWLAEQQKEIQAQLMPLQVFSQVEATVHQNPARAVLEKYGREYVDNLLRDRTGLTISDVEGRENFKIIGNPYQVNAAEFLLGHLYQTTTADDEETNKQNNDQVSPISLDKPESPDVKKENDTDPDPKQKVPAVVLGQEEVPSTFEPSEPAPSPSPHIKPATRSVTHTEKVIHVGNVDITMPSYHSHFDAFKMEVKEGIHDHEKEQERYSLKNRLSFFEQKADEQIIKRPPPVVKRTSKFKDFNQAMSERKLSDTTTDSSDCTKIPECISQQPVAKRTGTYRDFEEVMRQRRISDSSDSSEAAKISKDIIRKDNEQITDRPPPVGKRMSTYRDFEEVMRERKISGSSSDSSDDAKSPKNINQKAEEQINKRPPPSKYKDFEQAMGERKISGSSSDGSDDTSPRDINQNHKQDPTFEPDSGEADILAEDHKKDPTFIPESAESDILPEKSEIIETETASPTQLSVDSSTDTTKALISTEIQYNVCPICHDNCIKEKVLEKCKHVFCEECIDKSFVESGAQCPVCQTSYQSIDVEMIPERAFNQELGHDHADTTVLKYTSPDSEDKVESEGKEEIV